MASMVSILLALLVTFNTSGPITPINPGKTTGNLHISEKPRLGEISKIRLFEPMLIAQKARIISLFRIDFEKSLLVGYYNYRNRYYMPRIGRFLQTDPMGYMDSMNLYQAFGMNPVNFVDPFGEESYLDFLDRKIADMRSRGYSEACINRITSRGTFKRGYLALVDYRNSYVDEMSSGWGEFFSETGHGLWNVASLGTLNKVMSQENLGTLEGVFESIGSGGASISNTITFGLQDRIYYTQMEEGAGIKSIWKGTKQAAIDFTPVEEIKTIFSSETDTGEKLSAFFTTVSKVSGYVAGYKALKNKPLRRPYLRKSTREAIKTAARKTPKGEYLDPNTGKPISKVQYGHKRGFEHRRLAAKARLKAMSQKEFNNFINEHPEWFQIEEAASNLSHAFEKLGNYKFLGLFEL